MQRQIKLDSNGNYQLLMRMRLKTMFFSVTGSNTVNVYLSTSVGQNNGIPVLTGQALSIERWDTESEDFNSVIFLSNATLSSFLSFFANSFISSTVIFIIIYSLISCATLTSIAHIKGSFYYLNLQQLLN